MKEITTNRKKDTMKKKIIEKGTSINDPRPKSKRVQQDKRPKTLKVMAQKSKGVGKWI